MRPQNLLAAALEFLKALAGGRQFFQTGKGLRAGWDYGLSLDGSGKRGDVVIGVDGKRRHCLISFAGNPRHDMDHSYALEKQGNSNLNRPEAKVWRWSAPVAAN